MLSEYYIPPLPNTPPVPGPVSGLQGFMGTRTFCYHQALDANTTLTGLNGSPASGGNAAGVTAVTRSGGSYYNAVQRIRGTSSAVANQGAGWINQQMTPIRGDVAGIGGFAATCVQGCHLATASMRVIWGLLSSRGVPGYTVEPSTYFDAVFCGADSTDANLQIMCNDGVGACSKIDLGAQFPKNTADTDMYLVHFSAAAAAATIDYIVKRLNTGDTATGTLSSNLPTNTLRMQMNQCIATTTAASVAIDMVCAYCEEPFF